MSAPSFSSIVGGGTINSLLSGINLGAIVSGGDSPITYQWSYVGAYAPVGSPAVNVGTNSNFYSKGKPAYTDSGVYTCTATNSVGSATISTTLTVQQEPVLADMITESDTVLAGSSVQFTANATGTPPISYKWYFNGPSSVLSANTLIVGATAQTYSISSVSPQQAGYYVVTAANEFGGDAKQVALSVFKTQSDVLISANTINNGGGYTQPPKAVLTGGSGGSGGAASISAAQRYIRRIRITGGNTTYTSKPTISVTGGGNSGFVAVPILKQLISDYALKNIPVSADLQSKLFSPTVTVSINANGSRGIGATANPVLNPTGGGSILGIQHWNTGNNIIKVGVGCFGEFGTYKPWLECKPYYITKAFCTISADIEVVSVDGNGSGCTATISFNDVTGSFRESQEPARDAAGWMAPFDGLSYPAMPTGYTNVFNPQVTITNPGSGYTKQPLFVAKNIRTTLPGGGGDPLGTGAATAAWAYNRSPHEIAKEINNIIDPKQGTYYSVSPQYRNDGIKNLAIRYDLWPTTNGLAIGMDGQPAASIVSTRFTPAGQWPVMTYPPPKLDKVMTTFSSFIDTEHTYNSPDMDLFMRGGSAVNRTFSVGTVLPFPQGSIIIEDNFKLTGILITNPGHSYGLQTNCDIVSYIGATLPTNGNYMSKFNNAQPFPGQPVVVSPISKSYILESIGIISQGNGFTTTPTVTISGGGGSAVAVADMSCSALGPIRPANPNTLYPFPPTLVLKPVIGNENASGAVAVPILNTATSNANTGIDRVWVTNWAKNAYMSFYAHPTPPDQTGVGGWAIDAFLNDTGNGAGYLYNGAYYGTGISMAQNTDFALTISAPTGANAIPASINGGVSTMSWNLRNNTTNSNYFSVDGVSLASNGQGYDENTTAAVSIVPLNVSLPPGISGTIPPSWILRRVNPYRFTQVITPAELQVLTKHTISQIAIVDNGEGYIAPPYGKLYQWELGQELSTVIPSDETVGSTGSFSDLTAFVTSPGTGYKKNNSTFNNRNFVQGFIFTSNQRFTSAPTVTSADGSGAFFATVTGGGGVNLNIVSGGSGYTKWKDGDTNLIYDISTFNVVPGNSYATGAPRIPIITGGITNVYPPKGLQNARGSPYVNGGYPIRPAPFSTIPLPFFPSSRNAAMGYGYSFQIIKEPGDNGSGLQVEVVTAPFDTVYPFWGGSGSATYHPLSKFYPIPYVSGIDGADCRSDWIAAGLPVISGFRVTNPGSGYTKPPTIIFNSKIIPELVFNLFMANQPTMSNNGRLDYHGTEGGPRAVLVDDDALSFKFCLSSTLTGSITGVVNNGSGSGYSSVVSTTIKKTLPIINWQQGTYSPVIPADAGSAVITASVTTNSNMIENIYITNQGAGWSGTTGPTLEISGPADSVGTATPIMGPSYMKVQITNSGWYLIAPKVVITDAAGTGTGASAIALLTPELFLGYKRLTEIAFSSYGMAYQSPVITFVRDPRDQGGLQLGGESTATVTMVYNPNWPVVASGISYDGYGKNSFFGFNVSGDLEIIGTTGPATGVVTIPKSVTGVGSGAFVNNTNMTTVVFEEPSQSTYIGDDSGNPVFSNCQNLTKVYIPSSIHTIYPNAFNNCPLLKTVVVEGNTGPLTFPTSFTGCSPNLTVYVPSTFVTFRNPNGLNGYTDVANATVTSEIRNEKPAIYNTVTYKAGTATNPTKLVGLGPIAVDASGNIFFGYYPNGNINGYGGDRLIQLAAGVSYKGTTNAYSATYGFTNIQALACYENYVYALDGVPGDPQYIYYVVSGGPQTLGLDGSYTTAAPVRIAAAPRGKQLISIACDKTGNMYAADNSGVVWIATSTKLSTAISDGGIVKLTQYGNISKAITSIACDNKGAVYVTVPSDGCVIKFFPEDIDAPNAIGDVYATGLSSPCSITFDNVDNMYVSNLEYANGISILTTGRTGEVQTLRNGGPRADYIAFNPLTDSLLFVTSYLDNENSYRFLYDFPLKGNTTAPPSLLQALASHDYDTIVKITDSNPGSTYVLTTSDIVAINSTLPADSQVAIPEAQAITYVSPNYDGTITLPDNPPQSSVFIATSFSPNVSTMLKIGADTVYVIFNKTSPPTLTVSGPGVNYSEDIKPGESFNTVSGTTVTVYSIGLTVFNAVYGAVFVPGVGGVPPAVCKPKKQGIDYSLFLSSQLSNADVQTYKQAGAVDMSEWIRRKRSLHSTKFGNC